MRKTLYLFLAFFTFSVLNAQITTNPSPPEADKPVTIFFDKTGTPLDDYNGNLYAHTGVTVNNQQWQNVIGNWGDNAIQPQFTHVSGNVYKLEISTSIYDFYNVNPSNTISQMSFVVRNAEGNRQYGDAFVEVGSLQLNLLSPQENSTTNVNSSSNFNIHATSSVNANWILESNGNQIDTQTGGTTFNKNYTITQNQTFVLKATDPVSNMTVSKTFHVFIAPTVVSQTIPVGLIQGINYGTDHTKAHLVLYAPHKDFIHVIGSFNNWQLSNDYVMRRDTTNPDLYWIEIDNLTPNEVYTFQYRTSDGIKTADPYSTLVLSPWDDQWITTVMYPNLPAYPAGQEFEVSVLQTNQTPYQWQVTDFQRPAKENLMIYELLIRDFNSEKTWQSLIDDFDYFKNLNINAIEIMPVMEFEGNVSWGYNTVYHLALDKAYGDQNSMKTFIDLCHQNGIAVILDVALNHVFGRSPLVRMWMNDPDGDGFGEPTAQNPYAHTEAKHSWNVGYDLNHQAEATQYYTKRTIEYWMNEFKIDGFRWDLTKGFTNNCTSSDDSCTNGWQQDRVDIIKEYADYQWAIDPSFYVILEHLGVGDSHWEEIEWANYRQNEGKGIMLWDKFTNAYNQNTMGWDSDSNFGGIYFGNPANGNGQGQGYQAPRNITFAESHDEERMMYKNQMWGNASGSYDVKDLHTALDRQKALGAVLFTIPGPKMFWQFGELGYDFSINHCQNNTVNDACRTDPKPIPSEIGYTTDAKRLEVYDAWAQMINLRLTQEVFNTTTYAIDSGDLLPRIYVWNDNLPVSELKNVVVFANFTTTTQNITPYFPFTGTWHELMDKSVLNVTATDATFTVSLEPGEFRIFGNQAAKNTVIWTSQNEWSNVTGPTITDDVIIEGDLTVGEDFGSFEAKSLSLSAGSLIISNAASVTVEGLISNELTADRFVVMDGGNLIQNQNIVNNGSITVEKNSQPMYRNDMTLWSSPVANQNLKNFSPNTLDNRFWTYDEATNYYVNIANPSTTDFSQAEGVAIRIGYDVNFGADETRIHEGKFVGIPHNGDVSVNVSSTNDGYNLIGNPYPSNLNAHAFVSANPNVNTLYFWNHMHQVGSAEYNNNYVVFTSAGTNVPGLDNISVGQGFIVEVDNSTNQIVFNNNMRTADNALFYKGEKNRLWLNLAQDNNVLNSTLIAYMANATNGLDHQIDAKHMIDSPSTLYTWVEDNALAVQGRPTFETTDEVQIGYKVTDAGTFTINIAHSEGVFTQDQKVFLWDKLTDVIHDLSTAYTFHSESGEFNTRFKILYQHKDLSIIDEINPSSVQVYTQNQNIVVDAKTEKIESIAVYDLQGRIVYANPKIGQSIHTFSNNAKGVLVIKIKTMDGQITSRKIITK